MTIAATAETINQNPTRVDFLSAKNIPASALFSTPLGDARYGCLKL